MEAMEAVASVRVLVVDSWPVFREGLAALIKTADTLQVETQTAHIQEAAETARRFAPHAILLDVDSSEAPLVALLQALKEACPGVGVVALTESAEGPRVLDAIRAGVIGYLLRTSDREQLLEAVMSAAAGQPYLPSSVATRVLAHLGWPGRRAPSQEKAGLSPTELQVLTLMTGGLTNRDIAERVGTSERTVARRVSQIYAKLVVEDRSAAILKAIKYGIVSI